MLGLSVLIGSTESKLPEKQRRHILGLKFRVSADSQIKDMFHDTDDQGRYAEVETLYKRALTIQERVLVPNRSVDETILNPVY